MCALTPSEDTYRILYEDNPSMYFAVDEEGMVLSVNRFGSEKLGYPVDQLLGQPVTGVFHPEDRVAVKNQLQSCFDNPGTVFEWQLRKVRSDGSIMWVQELARAVEDTDGRAMVLIVCEDITDRRKAERDLHASRERYKTLYTATPAMLHSIDGEYRLLDVSEKWLEVLGYEREEVIGRPMTDFLTPKSQAIALGGVLENFIKQGHARDIAYEYVKKNGEIVEILLSAIAEYDENGDYVRSLAILDDVTEKNRAEAALQRAHDEMEQRVINRTAELQQSREHFRQLVETVRVIPWESSVEASNLSYVGPQAEDLLGHPRDRWYEEGFWSTIIHPEDRERVREFYARIAQARAADEMEYRLTAADGRIVWIHEVVNVITSEIDETPILRGFMIDITKRKQAEEALDQQREFLRESEAALRISQQRLQELAGKLLTAQEEERRRLAREIHDDLTQRLAGLGNKTGFLVQEIADGSLEETAEVLNEVHRELVRLSGDVHALSRELHPSMLEHLGLEDALRWECESFSNRSGVAAEFSSTDVPSDISKELGICFYRIAQEALNNVARHAETNRAAVSLSREKDVLELIVRDQGAGFVPDKRSSSQGIGLESMEERARLVHGEIEIETGPGKGTCVTVRVPLDNPVTTPIEAPSRPAGTH
jgi:PAS domain S-box-containing protein